MFTMRVANVVIGAVTILTFPRPTDAGVWSWFDKAPKVVEEQDAPTVAAVDDAPSLPKDTIPENAGIAGSFTEEEHVQVQTPVHEEYITMNTEDPRIVPGARDFVAWFRTNGGYGKRETQCIHYLSIFSSSDALYFHYVFTFSLSHLSCCWDSR